MQRLIKKAYSVDMEETLRSSGMKASKLNETKNIMYNVVENYLNDNIHILEDYLNDEVIIDDFSEYCKDNADDIIEKFIDQLCEVTDIEDGDVFYQLDELIKHEIIDDLIVGTTSTIYDVIDSMMVSL